MQRIVKLLVLLFLPVFSCSEAFTQGWTAPDDKAQQVSPVKFGDDTRKQGEIIFQRNCLSCHGTPGRANFVNLNPPPGDPATDKFQLQTDGALFFKIAEGRTPMPSFKDILSADERWQIISYIRSFNKNYVQPEPVATPAGVYTGIDIHLAIEYQADKKSIKVTANGTKDSITRPLDGLNVALFAKRYFGSLPIDEPKITNDTGTVYFNYNDSIPGDSAGRVIFIAKLNNEGLEGVKKETVLTVGLPMLKPSLIDTRAMWTVRGQAPVWLIILYTTVVLSVWGLLIYIVLQIIKMRKSGN
jgi:mono/diheme cytochrome c family protein